MEIQTPYDEDVKWPHHDFAVHQRNLGRQEGYRRAADDYEVRLQDQRDSTNRALDRKHEDFMQLIAVTKEIASKRVVEEYC